MNGNLGTVALPVLYSFRRCPYAMRARMALHVAGQRCELREVVLKRKPEALLAISAKGTVPVLQCADGTVIAESLEIMRWALAIRDPDGWLDTDLMDLEQIIADNDGPFKHHLDRTKYPSRYPEVVSVREHRDQACRFLERLEARLVTAENLCGARTTLADIAIFPFVRQFAAIDRAWFERAPFPQVRRWLDAYLGSRRFAEVMAKYPEWQPGSPPVYF